jgi:hypothetical protein
MGKTGLNKMKTNINSLVILMGLLLTLSSCSDNNIYFDIGNQSIRTCNNKVITKFHIISEDSKDFYYFSKLPEAKGTSNFSLIEIDHDYLLENMNGEISIDSFRLNPETSYKIENSTFGDADYTQVLIKTDKSGRVVYSNITSCK